MKVWNDISLSWIELDAWLYYAAGARRAPAVDPSSPDIVLLSIVILPR